MTNIFLCSDLHTNFHTDHGKSLIKSCHSKDVDIAVIAGDLTTRSYLESNLRVLCNIYPEVVYITGNHEYYHSSFDKIDNILRNLENKVSNFTYLNNDRKTVSGLNFIGATLWFEKTDDALRYKLALNDFRCIVDCDPMVFDKYIESVQFLKNNIQKDDIVITHHLPTYKSVAPTYKNSPYNCFFACNLDYLILDKKPALWLHGHTHQFCDYMYGYTRIACNPVGYPYENPFQTVKPFVIEV